MRMLIWIALIFSLFTVPVYAQDVTLAEQQTKFAWRGSEHINRAHNVALAAKLLDGAQISPGETFSFNKFVGPRTKSKGFRMAHIIQNGRLVDGIGGGTCQVASTLHAAALFAGMRIEEEHPHSRVLPYIGPTMDSTVSGMRFDLKLGNPYDFPVTVHAVAKRGKLRVWLTGREIRNDVTIEFDIHEKVKFETKKWVSRRLPHGRVKVHEPGSFGYDIDRIRTIRNLKTGWIITELRSYHYEPSDRLVEVGR